MLVFDVEVMWKVNPFAVMATAAGPDGWYSWLSPWLLGESENECQLIPLGDSTVPRVIVGHNIGYDRARILEEYDFAQTKNFYLDTMSMHVAVNGMCSRQRPSWIQHKKRRELNEKIKKTENEADIEKYISELRLMEEDEEELWIGRSAVNSLRDVAKFHCGINIDKEIRNAFGELTREEISEKTKLAELLDYCAADVAVTHKVYQKVFPSFLETCPHPVSFAALRHLSTVVLPVNSGWKEYLERSENTYLDMINTVQANLVELTERALALKDDPTKYENDPWLSQLDWSGQEIRYTKSGRPVAKQKMPGMPQWYKDLFPKANEPIKVSVRTRIAPIMFRLQWEGYPLIWSDIYGWTFRAPVGDLKKFEGRPFVRCDMSQEKIQRLVEDVDHVYFKVPHKDGPSGRCTNPMAKNYFQSFETGLLTSEFPEAREALEMNVSVSYWISSRERIKSQMVIWDSQKKLGLENPQGSPELGMILPQLIPMGTITRRAVEKTWLTASNAKRNRVGSELKSMVVAPPGYSFVGADVDSQELWIASLVGDSQLKIHGGTALGFMTLEGTKTEGTDLHSKTAGILGISRDDAKIFNYGRIYGAGMRYAATLLRQFNPSISDDDAQKTSEELYRETKGRRASSRSFHKRPYWYGGTESFVFNRLEEFADQDKPRTPVLGAGITEALLKRYIAGGYIPSRINWAIQSSGVDYLHLLIVGMDYLIQRYNLDARLSITVHDEIRYLVKTEQRYKLAMALQVANLWTRAIFAEQMGIQDLPQSCAFFSAIDVDHVLRKEVHMDCVTPSNPNPIPPGESVDIYQLLAKGDDAKLDDEVIPRTPMQVSEIPYTPRIPVLSEMDTPSPYFLRAQMARDTSSLQEIIKEYKKDTTTPKPKLYQKPRAKKKATENSFATVEEEEEPLYEAQVQSAELRVLEVPYGVDFSTYWKQKKSGIEPKRPKYSFKTFREPEQQEIRWEL